MPGALETALLELQKEGLLSLDPEMLAKFSKKGGGRIGGIPGGPVIGSPGYSDYSRGKSTLRGLFRPGSAPAPGPTSRGKFPKELLENLAALSGGRQDVLNALSIPGTGFGNIQILKTKGPFLPIEVGKGITASTLGAFHKTIPVDGHMFHILGNADDLTFAMMLNERLRALQRPQGGR